MQIAEDSCNSGRRVSDGIMALTDDRLRTFGMGDL